MKKLIFFVIICVIIFVVYNWQNKGLDRYEYFENGQTLAHFNGQEFAGSETCITCHEAIYNQHIKSAHYLTSTIPSDSTIKGIHEAITNGFSIGDHHKYSIDEQWNGFFQILTNDSINSPVRKDKIDIIIGSGVKGQSFFSWEGNELFQLQTSYFAPSKQWVNSPGFREEITPKTRPISVSCLECHATFAKMESLGNTKNYFSKRSIMLGIDCERCHGPSAKHVNYHEKFPNDTVGKHIIKQDQLSRQQKMDMCALCHSGSITKIPNKEFHFVLGDTLDNFIVKDFRSYYRSKHKSTVDVHGNQVELLESSACFKKTSTMDCNTCHDAHANERGNLTHFNSKCINCHQNQEMDCGIPAITHNGNNCIDCHMPISRSNALKVQNNDSLIRVKVRSHLIKIYESPNNKITQYISNLEAVD